MEDDLKTDYLIPNMIPYYDEKLNIFFALGTSNSS